MKVKDFYYRSMEEAFEFDFGYEEYLRDQQEPTEAELNLMERDFCKSLAVGNRIIAQKPLNNKNFNPQIGA